MQKTYSQVYIKRIGFGDEYFLEVYNVQCAANFLSFAQLAKRKV